MEPMTLGAFEEASDGVHEVAKETRLAYSDLFSKQNGSKVCFRPENLQQTGAYKVRGAYYKISTMDENAREKGLITAPTGNCAQGIAFVAKLAGVKATVYMPTMTPLMKINHTKALDAEVMPSGDVSDGMLRRVYEIAAETGATFVHPFDDLTVATDQGSITMEIVKELPTVDYALVPIGGDGLASGVSALAKLLSPNIHVTGVEPENTVCMKASLAASEVVTLSSANTIADGTVVKRPGGKVFPYVQRNLDDIITIQDNELTVSFLDMIKNHKVIAESLSLLIVAAPKHSDVENKKIVSILSGGNMDVITMASLIQYGLTQKDRIFTVLVLLPDEPGQSTHVIKAIAEESGSVIKLGHDQFVSVNRNAAVELRITMEVFGTEHKEKICERLKKEGYRSKLVRSEGTYNE